MGKKYNFSDDDIKIMVNMYVNKLIAVYDIAKSYNVDADVIRVRLVNSGVKIANGSPYSIEYWKQRGLTHEEAKEHIKTLRPVNKEYWVKLGYSEDDAILQIEGQKMTSLRGCISRFGNEEGKKIWDSRKLKRIEGGKMSTCGLLYWLNKGYNEEEAINLRSNRQSTFSLKKCIKSYGEEDGKKIFTERQLKWSNSLSSNGNMKMGYSKISQELFYKILEMYSIDDRKNVYFATHNKEFNLSKNDGGIWVYDFTDIKNKKIIEFNGDMYHGNPNKYIASDYPHPFRKNTTAQEIWDRDKKKYDTAIENGFDVLVIWDSEYRCGDKKKIIDKCINFLDSKGKIYLDGLINNSN